MNETRIKQLEKELPDFMKRFSADVRSYKNDDTFKLGSLVITKVEGSMVFFDYEYTGQCTLWPGHGKHSGKVDSTDTKGPNDLLRKIDSVITQDVEQSYIAVR
ncbi:hypothetical protein [Pantoea ananatis]|uniref:hypothetical protein n=1 Tax=Pantoea ananas TaxID=553 RepID=UPI0025C9B9DC|nr:hypothetical protein [Pantoea ananatis]MDN4134047.1 hypothetical protein [Pantoea ananatis]